MASRRTLWRKRWTWPRRPALINKNCGGFALKRSTTAPRSAMRKCEHFLMSRSLWRANHWFEQGFNTLCSLCSNLKSISFQPRFWVKSPTIHTFRARWLPVPKAFVPFPTSSLATLAASAQIPQLRYSSGISRTLQTPQILTTTESKHFLHCLSTFIGQPHELRHQVHLKNPIGALAGTLVAPYNLYARCGKDCVSSSGSGKASF